MYEPRILGVGGADALAKAMEAVLETFAATDPSTRALTDVSRCSARSSGCQRT